jgi:hypothetical protein
MDARPGSYLRQIDVPGVDTKFIERHRGILTDLLDLQLAPGRIDQGCPRSDFAGRYRFRKKPGYVRLRYLGGERPAGPAGAFTGADCGRGADLTGAFTGPDCARGADLTGAFTGPDCARGADLTGAFTGADCGRGADLTGAFTGPGVPGEFTEITVRADELTVAPPGISMVYVIENEITYLAFPPVENAIAIFGGGYAVSALESVAWLADRELFYWGDIDTHGFSILSRLRSRFPHVRSLLMDRATLLAHQTQWVTEPSPTSADLEYLLPDEVSLYRDLVENTLGPSVRLEQERVNFSAIKEALRT